MFSSVMNTLKWLPSTVHVLDLSYIKLLRIFKMGFIRAPNVITSLRAALQKLHVGVRCSLVLCILSSSEGPLQIPLRKGLSALHSLRPSFCFNGCFKAVRN